MNKLAAKDVIYTLGMKRHPEGGWYAETFVDVEGESGRAQSTAIYYLLEAGDVSHWHRVDAVEVWHYYAGAAIELNLSEGISVDRHVLGSDLVAGQRPQVVVPRDVWQSAKSLGDWTLVGCTVAPGFRFSGFEMAAENWTPGN